MYKAKVVVTLKKGVLDPQGTAVVKSLNSMGYQNIEDVRIGKYMEIKVNSFNKESASQEVEEICKKLLANPVIEDYHYSLEEV